MEDIIYFGLTHDGQCSLDLYAKSWAKFAWTQIRTSEPKPNRLGRLQSKGVRHSSPLKSQATGKTYSFPSVWLKDTRKQRE